jgi:EF hand
MPDGTRAASGYAALAQYDTNHDGVINSSDAIYKQLQVWVDANGDGKVEAGEMKSLSQLGITSLDLHATASNTAENGSSIGLTSTYTTASGATHQMADVNLTKADATTTDASTATTSTTSTTPHLSDLLAAPATNLLPGHVETAALHSTHAGTTSTHGLLDQRLMEEEERHRNQQGNPLI